MIVRVAYFGFKLDEENRLSNVIHMIALHIHTVVYTCWCHLQQPTSFCQVPVHTLQHKYLTTGCTEYSLLCRIVVRIVYSYLDE